MNEALEGDQGLVELIRATFKYWVEPIDKGAKAVIEKCVSLIGDTGTGKGTLLEVLIAIIGERFVGAFDANTFSSPEKLAVFVGKDLAIDADADPVFMSATGTFSKVVSNEPVAVKILFKDPTTVRLGVRLIRAMNEMPPANGGRHGGDRREIFIPFDKKPDVIDPQLSEKLRAELPGIFQWAHQLDASVMHHTIANWASCKKVAAKTAENWIQRNTEYRFLLDEFPSGAVRVGASDLYKQYKAWCSLNGFAPKNNTNFGKAMAGFQGVTSKKSNGVRYSIPSMESYNVMQHFGGAKASPSTATQGTTEEFITEYNYTVGDEDAPPPDADEYGADGLNVDGFAPFKPESSDTGPGYWNGRN